jgi:hypothetical protein
VETESDDDDEIKYRQLNIFEDKKIDRVTYETDSVGRDIITSGRPLDFIDSMIFPFNQDFSFSDVFLASFRYYITTTRVLDAFIEWYNVDIDEGASTEEELFLKKSRRSIQYRVIRILTMWIKGYWQDFVADAELYCELMKFVAHASTISFGDAEKLIQAIREQVYTTNYKF